jgi:hypothetical protein
MPATNYDDLEYARLWELLEGHAPVAAAVKPGNRVKLTAGAIVPPKMLMDRKQTADYPELMLLPGDFEWPFFTDKTAGYPVYNSGAVIANQSWLELDTQSYNLTISHGDAKWTAAGLLLAEVKTAIRKGGPRLGLSWIWRFGPVTGGTAVEASEDTREKWMLISRLRIPIVRRLQGETLLG